MVTTHPADSAYRVIWPGAVAVLILELFMSINDILKVFSTVPSGKSDGTKRRVIIRLHNACRSISYAMLKDEGGRSHAAVV